MINIGFSIDSSQNIIYFKFLEIFKINIDKLYILL